MDTYTDLNHVGRVDTIVAQPLTYRDYQEREGVSLSLKLYVEKVAGFLHLVGKRVLGKGGSMLLYLGDEREAGIDLACQTALLGTPWRIAIALQDKGWMLRLHTVWSDEPSPEDRPFDHIFLLSLGNGFYHETGNLSMTHTPNCARSDLLESLVVTACAPGSVLLDLYPNSDDVQRAVATIDDVTYISLTKGD